MIAKEVERKEGTSSFTRLVHYLTDPQGNAQRVVQVRAHNLQNDAVEDELGLECALAEVGALQQRNTRATEKTLHLMLSFHEDLPLATLAEIEQRIVSGLGYGDHQRISVVHGDTDHAHVHVAINKVYQTRNRKGQTRYLNRHQDFSWIKLAPLATRMELDYGLVPDAHGNKTWNADRQAELIAYLRTSWVKDVLAAKSWDAVKELAAAENLSLKASGKAGLRLVGQDGFTLAASKVDRRLARTALERRLGAFPQPSSKRPHSNRAANPRPLQERLRQDARPALRAAKDWPTVHDIADEHGTRLVRRGGGLAFEDQQTGELVTASQVDNQLSLGRAQQRLGPYAPPANRSDLEALCDDIVDLADKDAKRAHLQRRKAIQAALPRGTDPRPWLTASHRTHQTEAKRVADLQQVGFKLRQAQNRNTQSAATDLRKPTKPLATRFADAALALFYRYAQRLRGRSAALPAPLNRALQNATTQGPHHAPPPRNAQPHHSIFARKPPARHHSLHALPKRPVVRPAQRREVLLPRDARGVVHEREAGGAGGDV